MVLQVVQYCVAIDRSTGRQVTQGAVCVLRNTVNYNMKRFTTGVTSDGFGELAQQKEVLEVAEGVNLVVVSFYAAQKIPGPDLQQHGDCIARVQATRGDFETLFGIDLTYTRHTTPLARHYRNALQELGRRSRSKSHGARVEETPRTLVFPMALGSTSMEITESVRNAMSILLTTICGDASQEDMMQVDPRDRYTALCIADALLFDFSSPLLFS